VGEPDGPLAGRVPEQVRTHWISPDLPDKKAERVIERQSAPPDLVVIQPVKDFTCAECGDGSGDLLTMDDAGPLCMSCADLDHLVFLPAGDAALTRRAKKASRLSAVVVWWTRSRKRYERQGLLVEDDELLMSGTARADARTRIKPAIDRMLAAWSTGDALGSGPERDGQDHAADQRRTSPA
jgi:hypothetical protein